MIKKNNQSTQPVKKGTGKRLFKYVIEHNKGKFFLVLLTIIIGSVVTSSVSIFLKNIVDKVVVPGLSEGFDVVVPALIQIVIVMASVFIVGVICSTVQGLIMADVTQDTLMRLRKDLFNKMEVLPIRYFDTNKHGDIMSTYTNDVDAIRQLIGQSIVQLSQAIIMVVTIFVIMLTYSIWLTLLICVVLGLLMAIIKNIGSKSGKYMKEQQKNLAIEEGFVEEMVTGQKVVKVFCHEEKAVSDFNKINNDLYQASNQANKLGNMLMPIIMNMGNIMYVLVVILGVIILAFDLPNLTLVGINSLSIGVVIAFLNMSNQFAQTIGQASNQVIMISSGLAGAGRVFELIDQQPENDEGYVNLVNIDIDADGNIMEKKEQTGKWAWKHYHKADDTTTYTRLSGNIELDHIDFGYVEGKQILKDITLNVEAGQKVAIVGSTGAGKTTITNLINRFYDLNDGKIRYDGINITKIVKPDLRKSFGIVLQDVNLFTGTVMENIRYGRLEASDEDCINASKLANAHGFIERLPNGYDTMLTNNGDSLSQGQRQLISIARAAVANAPAIILDEATSSIDTRTEALVQQGMDNLMKGRTTLVIAHRLSTVRNSDIIIVLEKGQIIEKGNHDQLIAQKGYYYKLYNGAFELD